MVVGWSPWYRSPPTRIGYIPSRCSSGPAKAALPSIPRPRPSRYGRSTMAGYAGRSAPSHRPVSAGWTMRCARTWPCSSAARLRGGLHLLLVAAYLGQRVGVGDVGDGPEAPLLAEDAARL